MLQLKALYRQVKGGVYLRLKKFIALGFVFHFLLMDSPTGGKSMPFSLKGWNQMSWCRISYDNDVIFKSSKMKSQFIYLINIIISRIAKKLNYKRPFLKIALPSMFFLADQMMDVYYHQMLISDVVALILFFSFCIIFLYGCFNTIQLRRMVSYSLF